MAQKEPKKILLLGGSFNPAHIGHVNISLNSSDLCNSDEIWWIIAKQNPLKTKYENTNFDQRYIQAKEITKKYKKIKILDIEQKNNLIYSLDTIKFIKNANPNHRFSWLMGDDNAKDFHLWKNWKEFISNLNICIYNRKQNIKNTLFYKEYEDKQISPNSIFYQEFGNWCYIEDEIYDISSTIIRKNNENGTII